MSKERELPWEDDRCSYGGRHLVEGQLCSRPKDKRGPAFCPHASLFAEEARRAAAIREGTLKPEDVYGENTSGRGKVQVHDIQDPKWSRCSTG